MDGAVTGQKNSSDGKTMRSSLNVVGPFTCLMSAGVFFSERTVLKEFDRVAFRKKPYRRLKELQANLGAWLRR